MSDLGEYEKKEAIGKPKKYLLISLRYDKIVTI